MYKRLLHRLLSLVALCTTLPVLAASEDFKLPIKIDAVSQFLDSKKKVSISRENVRITQGSMQINADEVEVDASFGDGNEIFIARGAPASYSQMMDDGTQLYAQADEIRYTISDKKIALTGNAELRQDSSLVQGDSITFDLAKEQLVASGNKDGENGRVTTVFHPRVLEDKQAEQTDTEQTNEQESNDGGQP